MRVAPRARIKRLDRLDGSSTERRDPFGRGASARLKRIEVVAACVLRAVTRAGR
jgi:hypothetical protein